MNYEQKYKSALEWIRSIYPTMQGADKEDAEHYFPELRESEDEKIRKEIIDFIQEREIVCSNGDSFLPYKKWIAWLEKQGKQDALKDLPKWKKAEKDEELYCPVAIQQDDRVILSDFVQKDEYYITLDVLKKLPKEE